jgi:SAM-dependent methyltransferase
MNKAEKRTSIIRKHFDPEGARILEIGALNSPTFTKNKYRVEYADYASKAELAEGNKTNPRYAIDGLVDVDHVIAGRQYHEIIRNKFDIIVANHVVEHVPDVLGWLHDLGQVLVPNGIVFLSVPDRRFTFDIARRESNFIDLLRPHINRQVKPDFFNLLDHFWHYKPVKVADVMEGRHHELMKIMRFSPENAISQALRISKLPYAAVHCHVFTDTSFADTFPLLREFGYFAYRDIRVQPTEVGSQEFHAVLGGFDASLYRHDM